jgi:hypothetical protein
VGESTLSSCSNGGEGGLRDGLAWQEETSKKGKTRIRKKDDLLIRKVSVKRILLCGNMDFSIGKRKKGKDLTICKGYGILYLLGERKSGRIAKGWQERGLIAYNTVLYIRQTRGKGVRNEGRTIY